MVGCPTLATFLFLSLGWETTNLNLSRSSGEKYTPREILWTDAEEIGIQLQEKFPDLNPLTVRFTDLHRYVAELEDFADDPAKSNESRLEAIQMAWHEEWKDAQG